MIKGTVQKIHKNGKAYNIVIDDEFYGYGFNRPDFEEGTLVKFEVSMNGKWKNVDKDTLKVLGKGELKSPKVSATRVSSGTSQKDTYWADKEKRDIRNDLLREVGATRNTAISFVDLLLKTGALDLPKAKPKQADALLQAVEHYAEWFRSNATDTKTSEGSGYEEVEDMPESDLDDEESEDTDDDE